MIKTRFFLSKWCHLYISFWLLKIKCTKQTKFESRIRRDYSFICERLHQLRNREETLQKYFSGCYQDIRGKKCEYFVDLKYKRLYSKLQIRDMARKNRRIGAESVPLMHCVIFNLYFKNKLKTIRMQVLLFLCKGIQKSEVRLQCICNKN